MTTASGDLASFLESRASLTPDAAAYIWLSSGEEETERIDYAGLHRSARCVASALRSEPPLRRAVLLYPAGLPFVSAFFGCIYAGVIAVPLSPPHRDRDVGNLRRIFENCLPSIVLTTQALAARVAELVQAQWEMTVPVLATDALADDISSFERRTYSPETSAYIQYTSGSTDTPRGVVITHRNVISNMSFIERGFLHDDETVEVCWLPAFHDMGLVYGILQPVFAGFPCVLMPPSAFVQNPLRWLKAITKYRATHSGGPNFSYELCTRSLRDAETVDLDLSSWRVAFNGAEPIMADTLQRFERAFGCFGFKRSSFYPAYGLAEATLKVSGAVAQEKPRVVAFNADSLAKGLAASESENAQTQTHLVACGRPDRTADTIIVDPESFRKLEEGQIGEIWTKGPGVALGYLNNQSETARAFRAFTLDDQGPFLRTGDLGFFHQGYLFVTGRSKDLIIVNGRNFYPHDIESAAEQNNPVLRPHSTLAFSVPSTTGTEEIVLIVETKLKTQESFDTLAASIRHSVAVSTGLALSKVMAVQIAMLPRTSSGKLRRSACRDEFLKGTLAVRFKSEPDQSDMQAHAPDYASASLNGKAGNERSPVSAIVAEWLHEQADNDASGPIAALPLDSIATLQLTYRIESKLGIRIAPAELIDCVTFGDLIAHVELLGERRPVSSSPAEISASSAHRIGYAQLSLLYRQVLSPESDALNVSRVVQVLTALREDVLEESLKNLVARHSALRSSFPGFPELERVEVRPAPQNVCLIRHRVQTWEALESKIQSVVRAPFDLANGPLFRLTILLAPNGNTTVVIACHHAICDLWSLAVIFDDLWREYAQQLNGASPSDAQPSADFTDFVREEEIFVASAAGQRSEQYWKTALQGSQVLTLAEPPPSAAPGVHKVQHDIFVVPSDVLDELRICSHRLGLTLPELSFALFRLMTSYDSGFTAFRTGTSVHGRPDGRYARMVGCAVNVVPVETSVRSDCTARQSILDAVESARASLKHSGYPYFLNLQVCSVASGSSASTLEVMFNFYKTAMPNLDSVFMPLFLGHPGYRIQAHGLEMVTGGLYQSDGQHQITWSLGEYRGGLLGAVEWSVDLFDHHFIERLQRHYCQLIADLSKNLDCTAAELLYGADRDLQTFIRQINDTDAEYPEWGTLAEALERQALLTPKNEALVSEEGSLSYDELHTKAQVLADVLIHAGIGIDQVVGILADRSLAAIIGIVGIIRASAAYMPIDSEYPNERMRKMLSTARCSTVVCSAGYLPRLHEVAPEITAIGLEHVQPAAMLQCSRPAERHPDSLAYVIFTSGSTGEPKGVMVSHRSICNRLQWMHQHYRLTAVDRVLQKTPFTFDVSVWEVFWPLLAGATLVLSKPEGHRDPFYLANLIDEQAITTLHFVPSMLRTFCDALEGRTLPSLRLMICSGEALPAKLATEVARTQRARLDNLYGPTEAAIDVTSRRFEIDGEASTVSIGDPISNVEVYVLDESLCPVPEGRIGELCLGGAALARGYIHAAAITADRFVPNPYGNKPGARLYQTGDLVRYDSGRRLQYVGRKDNQVKLRGQRIELGEIEATIRLDPAVKDCCVRLLEPASPNAYLTAYVQVAGNDRSIVSHLQDALRARLPLYMVPAQFICLDSFPTTPNGKLDARSLPLPTISPAEIEEEPAKANYDPITNTVVTIWREVLRVEHVNTDDSFFVLGGHSLAATQVLARIRKEFNIKLPFSVMFSDDVTVSAIAREISSRIAVAAPAVEDDQVIACAK